MLVAAGIVGVVVGARLSRASWSLGRVPTPVAAPWALRGSWRRRRPPASSTRTTAGRRSRRAAGWPSWTATRTVARTCTWPVAPTPRSCSATAATSGASWRSRRLGDAVTDGHGRHRRLPARRGRGRAHGSRGPPSGRDAHAARPRGLPVRAGQRGVGAPTAVLCVDDRILGGLGGRSDACRRSPSATTSSSIPSGEPANACATSELYRPGAAGTGYGPRSRSSPGTARCRCCSATGTAPAGATCA